MNLNHKTRVALSTPYQFSAAFMLSKGWYVYTRTSEQKQKPTCKMVVCIKIGCLHSLSVFNILK